MSKSYKLPIYKDGTADAHRFFRRKIKRIIRQKVRDIKNLLDVDSYELPSSKSLVNDYDWSDYKLDYRFVKRPKLSYWNNRLDEWNRIINESKIKCSRK